MPGLRRSGARPSSDQEREEVRQVCDAVQGVGAVTWAWGVLLVVLDDGGVRPFRARPSTVSGSVAALAVHLSLFGYPVYLTERRERRAGASIGMGNRYGALLLALLASLLIYSFLGMNARVWWLVDAAALAILVAAVRAIPHRRRRVIVAALGIAAVVVTSLGGSISLDPAYPVAVFGACCVYVLLGMAWGAAYALLEWIVPGSFEFDNQVVGGTSARASESALLYFSLVTLSTVGYGDLAPYGSQARTLAAVEGLVAQLFLAIVIARFVAMELTSRRGGPS
jgi:hypothetical protein